MRSLVDRNQWWTQCVLPWLAHVALVANLTQALIARTDLLAYATLATHDGHPVEKMMTASLCHISTKPKTKSKIRTHEFEPIGNSGGQAEKTERHQQHREQRVLNVGDDRYAGGSTSCDVTINCGVRIATSSKKTYLCTCRKIVEGGKCSEITEAGFLPRASLVLHCDFSIHCASF